MYNNLCCYFSCKWYCFLNGQKETFCCCFIDLSFLLLHLILYCVVIHGIILGLLGLWDGGLTCIDHRAPSTLFLTDVCWCLCQTRLTADKSMRLLLSTFSSLREELLHMSEDLRVTRKHSSVGRQMLTQAQFYTLTPG